MVELWAQTRNFIAADFALADIADSPLTVSIGIPALNEAETIGPILECLVPLREAGTIDQVAVFDSGSADATADVARSKGAEVFEAAELLSQFGPVAGKGDVLWRAQSVLTGDITCFFDADLGSFNDEYVAGICGPLVADQDIEFVKSTFDRPFVTDDRSATEEAGRLTQMAARPLIAMLYPELSVFHQPLSGQIAARRGFLRELPFTTAYGVDIGLLIDAYAKGGLDAIAQVDIGTLLNRHRSVEDLSAMAAQIYQAVFRRLHAEGRLTEEPGHAMTVERPPLISVFD
jgi:glucosyl-3-phosphoglycerate synthase